MRILYLCHRIPYPPNKGDKIRAFHQIKAMAAKHEVDLFTLADDPGDLAHQEDLKQYCRELTVARLHPRAARLKAIPYLLTAKPMTLPYFYSAELAASVRRALGTGRYDRIFVYCSAMAQYVESAGDVPKVVDFVDVDSDKWMQYAAASRFPFPALYRREGRRLRDYERKICENADSVMVSTEREAALLRQISDAAPIHAIPNGVDTAYFDASAVPPARTAPTIIFVGDMAYFPNQQAAIYFARQVLPLIRQSARDVRFLVVGRNPNKEVLRLREIEDVEVTGFVPDVRTYLAKAHVAVAPFLIAAGIQNKILEAMAYGLPVAATSRAVQGLAGIARDQVEQGDTPEELASKITLLLRDSELTAARAINGRRVVVESYSWDSALKRVLQLMEHPAGREFQPDKKESSVA